MACRDDDGRARGAWAGKTLGGKPLRRLTVTARAGDVEPASERPRTWGECQSRGLGTSERPCPFVSCKHHLYLDVKENGSIRFAAPHVDPDEMEQTCALRVAESGGGLSTRDAGRLVGLTGSRVRQLEEVCFAKLRAHALPSPEDFAQLPARPIDMTEDRSDILGLSEELRRRRPRKNGRR